MHALTDPDGKALMNRQGRQLYMLDSPLMYDSDVAGLIITAPTGFVSDLASIPRWPIVYFLLNAEADVPSVTHDFLYSTAVLPRKLADEVFKEASILTGVPEWKAWGAFIGVRIGGSGHYGAAYKA
jgi:hypothetical protein